MLDLGRSKIRLVSHTIYQDKHHKDQNLNVKNVTIKVIEEKN